MRMRAARTKGATRGQRRQIRRLTVDRRQAAAAVAFEPGNGAQQSLRVGVARIRVERRGGAAFYDPAAIHHRHPVGVTGHDAEVVRDQDEGRIRLPGALLEQLQDLRLHRHVERGGRLVGDQQARMARERHRDHDPLPHAARELVRVVAEPLPGIGNGDGLQVLHCLLKRLAPLEPAVQAQRFGDLAADRQHRIERRHRLLEDHRDAVAPNPPDTGVVERQQVLAFEQDTAILDPSRLGNQPQDGERGDALARPALADDRQGLPGRDVQRQ